MDGRGLDWWLSVSDLPVGLPPVRARSLPADTADAEAHRFASMTAVTFPTDGNLNAERSSVRIRLARHLGGEDLA